MALTPDELEELRLISSHMLSLYNDLSAASRELRRYVLDLDDVIGREYRRSKNYKLSRWERFKRWWEAI